MKESLLQQNNNFCESSRILAVDFGRKRVGLAISDDSQIAITTLPQLLFNERNFWTEFKSILLKYEPQKIVVGNPFEGMIQKEIKDFVRHVRKIFTGDIVEWDESFSSKQAEDLWIKLANNKTRGKKKVIKKKETLIQSQPSLYSSLI